MPDTITDPIQLKEIRRFHMHNYDKLRMMHTGTSSHLISFENGILHLRVRVPASRRVHAHKLALGASQGWNSVPGLTEARAYRTRVYERHAPAGVAVNSQTTPAGAIVAAILAFAEVNKHPELDLLLEVIEGTYPPSELAN